MQEIKGDKFIPGKNSESCDLAWKNIHHQNINNESVLLLTVLETRILRASGAYFVSLPSHMETLRGGVEEGTGKGLDDEMSRDLGFLEWRGQALKSRVRTLMAEPKGSHRERGGKRRGATDVSIKLKSY